MASNANNPMMQQQMAMMGGMMGGMPPQPVVQATPVPAEVQGPAAKIMELKGLLDAGVITQEDFDKKKAELLGSM